MLYVKVLSFPPFSSSVFQGLERKDGGERGAKETAVTTALRKRRTTRKRKSMHFGPVLRWRDSSFPGHTHLVQVNYCLCLVLYCFFIFSLSVYLCNTCCGFFTIKTSLYPSRCPLIPALHPFPSSWWQTARSRHFEAEGGAFLCLSVFGRALATASSRSLLWLAVCCSAPGGLDTSSVGEWQSVSRGRGRESLHFCLLHYLCHCCYSYCHWPVHMSPSSQRHFCLYLQQSFY